VAYFLSSTAAALLLSPLSSMSSTSLDETHGLLLPSHLVNLLLSNRRLPGWLSSLAQKSFQKQIQIEEVETSYLECFGHGCLLSPSSFRLLILTLLQVPYIKPFNILTHNKILKLLDSPEETLLFTACFSNLFLLLVLNRYSLLIFIKIINNTLLVCCILYSDANIEMKQMFKETQIKLCREMESLVRRLAARVRIANIKTRRWSRSCVVLLFY